MAKKKNSMDFGGALKALRAGKSVAREDWGGARLVMNEDRIDMMKGDCCVEPFWSSPQADLLAEDWAEVEADPGGD